MKKAIVLAHVDVIAALTAYVAEHEPNEEIGTIQLSLNGDGEATAVINTVETEAKASSGRGSRRGNSADAGTEEVAETKSRRGSRTAKAEVEPEPTETVEDQPKSRSRRGATKDAEATAETPATTSRSRRGKTAEPVAPTVPEKAEDDYDIDPSEADDENVTYWQNNDEPTDVFAVPAGQLLPDPELYTELESEEAALEALQENAAEVEPEPEAPKTRTRRGAATKEEAPAETAPVTRTRRGSTAQAETEAPKEKRRVFAGRGK